MTVEPGRLLAGRYRVEDLLSDRAGARSWRAVDQVLQRSVALDILPAEAPRAAAVLDAARRSAVVTDGRFLRVLDAAQEQDDVYVVREWAAGESLDLILAGGALAPRRASWLVREVAEALSSAHRRGIHHLRLVPENVIVTDNGAVKVVGLATEAAMHGVKHADAEEEDVRGIGRLLYACLVARWPGGSCGDLPAAPTEHGRMLRPRQVRAGVPRPLDAVCDRILGEPPRQHAAQLRNATAVVEALSHDGLGEDALPDADPEATQVDLRTVPWSPAGHMSGGRLPRTAGGPAHASTSGSTTTITTGPTPDSAAGGPSARAAGTATPQPASTPPPIPPAASTHEEAPRRSRRVRPWLLALITLLAVGAGAAAFYVGGVDLGDGGDPEPPPGRGDTDPDPTAAALQRVPVQSAQAFDPFGEDGENDDAAALAIDGDDSSAWTTVTYFDSADFNGAKPGLGLVLDLGRPTDVSRVVVDVGQGGTDLELRSAPDDAAAPPDRPAGFRTVATVDGASGGTVLEPEAALNTRYLLIWLTSIPPSGDDFQGQISEIVVRG